MQPKPLSPRGRSRKSMFDQYGGRGAQTTANRWLVYSVKTDRDWILPSDRQLVHWVIFLETNIAVQSFNLAPEVVLSADAKEVRATELDAEVVYQDGHLEWHEVKSGDYKHPSHQSQLLAQAAAASAEGIKYRIFDDKALHGEAALALRWLTAISFAATIRDNPHTAAQNSLASFCYRVQRGIVKDLLQQFGALPQPIAIGVLVRLAISGALDLDLRRLPLGLHTPWQSHQHAS